MVSEALLVEQSLAQSYVLDWELLLEQGSVHLPRVLLVRPLVDLPEKSSLGAEKLSQKVSDLNSNSEPL